LHDEKPGFLWWPGSHLLNLAVRQSHFLGPHRLELMDYELLYMYIEKNIGVPHSSSFDTDLQANPSTFITVLKHVLLGM
jgi:hypothetical protein